MPRAPRACPVPGCPAERGKCEAHRPVAWAEKGNPRAETGNKAVRRSNAEILARDGHRCYLCGAPATQVDHMLAVCFGGEDHPHNKAAICVPCHRAKTAQEAAEMRRRYARDRRQRHR